MSLRRRIAVAAALAVAAVAVAISVVGYVSTRSHLIGEVKSELVARAQGALEPHGGPGGPEGPGPPDQGRHLPFHPPLAPGLGGAAGYFQVVEPDGKVDFGGELPVTAPVLNVGRRHGGSFFTDAHVHGTHVEIYTVWDPPDAHVVQVALPLTGVDTVANGLLLPYGLLIGGGILFALLLGTAVSRSALAPIGRFIRRTEDVTTELDRPSPLEEAGPVELRRLAATFNQTLAALERSIGAQRNLVADASHELRTPIAALRSNIQIFLEADRLPAQDREGLQESILAELDELTQLVDNVVELARDSAPSAHREPIELDSIVRDAVERTQRRAPTITFNLDLEPTVVEGAPDRIGRAVTNVIDNARKWSPPDGAIDVRLHDGLLAVRDHGPGFDVQDLPHVFDRFYRAADARRLPGSGLGLAIVSQAARSHGGTARAGNASGGGALVEVSFGAPVAQPASGDGPPVQIS